MEILKSKTRGAIRGRDLNSNREQKRGKQREKKVLKGETGLLESGFTFLL